MRVRDVTYQWHANEQRWALRQAVQLVISGAYDVFRMLQHPNDSQGM